MALEICLLGPTTARSDGAEVALGGPRQRGVAAVLALATPDPVTPEALIEALWGEEPPAKARETVRVYISRLRSALGGDHLVRTPGGYRLHVDEVDAHTFTDHARHGRVALEDGDLGAAADLLAAALERWHGPALGDVLALPFAAVAAARLEELRLQATEDLLEARLGGGAAVEALPGLQALVDEQPFRERAAGLLMHALYRTGRQAEALGVFTALRARLVEGLGVEPGAEVRQLHQRILAHDPALLTDATATAAPAASPEAGPVAAPPDRSRRIPVPLSSFVGREEELATARDLLDTGRVLTLTGAGGCGKTRLALELARQQEALGGQEVVVVELAGVAEGALVASAVADALGVAVVSGQQVDAVLLEVLHDRPVLLVLDNCEHVVEEVAVLVERLLQRCPSLRLLATSREPLGFPGERVVVVPSLRVARDGAPGEAEQLFAERAAAVDPGFALDDATRPVVRRICAELDGIPLAIELAAARLQLLSLEQIAAMLDDRFALLTSGSRTAVARHRTLEATVAWSHDLLEEDERALFAGASVFRGGFSLDALEAVTGVPSTLDVLARLVSKSMVVVEAGPSGRRYRMLETLREYAARQLADDEHRALADRHAAWCGRLVEEAHCHLRGADDAPWWSRLAVEQHNLRAALRHTLEEGQHEVALQIVGPLSWYWYRRGPVQEGRRWLAAVLEMSTGAPGQLRARAHLGRALLGYLAGVLQESRDELEAAAEAIGAEGDPAVCALTELYLGYFDAAFGDPDVAEARLRRAGELAAEAPPWVRPELLMILGQLHRAKGQPREADRVLLEGRRLALQVGHRWCAGSCGWIAAKARLDQGRPGEAAALLARVVSEIVVQGDRTSTLAGLHTMAAALAALGHSEDAAVLLGAVDAIGERIGFSPARMDAIDGERHREEVTRRLPADVFAAAHARGRDLDLRGAVRLATSLVGLPSRRALQGV